MSARAILERAKALLLEKGWGQNAYLDNDTGCFCLMGAIQQAANGDARNDALYEGGEAREATRALATAIDGLDYGGCRADGAVILFNDRADRDEVFAKLDEAIASLPEGDA